MSDGSVELVVESTQFRDSTDVSTTLELGVEPGVHRVLGDLVSDESLSEAQDVRVVVLPGESCRGVIVHRRCTDAADLVGRDADADARTTHADAEVHLTARDRPTDRCAEVGVVDAVVSVGAQVHDLDAPLSEVGREEILQVDACVIGADGDASDRAAHEPTSVRSRRARNAVITRSEAFGISSSSVRNALVLNRRSDMSVSATTVAVRGR